MMRGQQNIKFNIGQVSAKLREWFALSFCNRICHAI